MEIFYDKREFSKATVKIDKAIDTLSQYHSKFQKEFSDLTSTWKGTSADSCNECSARVSDETSMALYMTATLGTLIKESLKNAEEADLTVVNTLAGKESL